MVQGRHKSELFSNVLFIYIIRSSHSFAGNVHQHLQSVYKVRVEKGPEHGQGWWQCRHYCGLADQDTIDTYTYHNKQKQCCISPQYRCGTKTWDTCSLGPSLYSPKAAIWDSESAELTTLPAHKGNPKEERLIKTMQYISAQRTVSNKQLQYVMSGEDCLAGEKIAMLVTSIAETRD